jgi:hypothetical protein
MTALTARTTTRPNRQAFQNLFAIKSGSAYLNDISTSFLQSKQEWDSVVSCGKTRSDIRHECTSTFRLGLVQRVALCNQIKNVLCGVEERESKWVRNLHLILLRDMQADCDCLKCHLHLRIACRANMWNISRYHHRPTYQRRSHCLSKKKTKYNEKYEGCWCHELVGGE